MERVPLHRRLLAGCFVVALTACAGEGQHADDSAAAARVATASPVPSAAPSPTAAPPALPGLTAAPPPATPAATPAPSPVATIVATGSGDGRLVELAPGDRACYVTVETPRGDRTIEGAFELCAGGARDASGMLGSLVVYETQTSRVLAAACQGDPACGESDEVAVVVAIRPAP